MSIGMRKKSNISSEEYESIIPLSLNMKLKLILGFSIFLSFFLMAAGVITKSGV